MAFTNAHPESLPGLGTQQKPTGPWNPRHCQVASFVALSSLPSCFQSDGRLRWRSHKWPEKAHTVELKPVPQNAYVMLQFSDLCPRICNWRGWGGFGRLGEMLQAVLFFSFGSWSLQFSARLTRMHTHISRTDHFTTLRRTGVLGGTAVPTWDFHVVMYCILMY